MVIRLGVTIIGSNRETFFHPTMSSPFDGLNISKIMSSTGPVVKCVLLRAAAAATADDNDEGNPKADDETKENETSSVLHPHQHLIDEIEVDTTPRKSQVNTILGGPFTFLGQYEEEGIVIMIRLPRLDDDDRNDEEDDDKKHGPINPHRLQPPFHNVMVRGDILFMKVAPVTDDDDMADATFNEVGDVATKIAVTASMTAPSLTTTTNDNDEFFLDYTKEEYLIFASRSDIIAEDEEENGDEEESISSNGDDENDKEAVEFGGEDCDDSDNEEDFDPNNESDDDDDDDDDEEESQVAMMNMVLNMMIKQFREKNDGRGPDSAELLAMRKALADKMGIENVTGPNHVTSSKAESNQEERRSAKKVVVAEEMNETTPIPRRRSRSSSSEEEEEDDDIEEVYNKEVKELKRPAPQDDDDNDVQEQGSCRKKAKTT